MSCLVVVLTMLLGTAGFLWLAAEYTRWHPLDLTSRVPQVQKYLMPDGIGLQADKVELFFDGGPVLRVNGLGVTGSDGTLGIFVEEAAIKLASTQFFLLSAAPKVIEASGVTLRIVRSAHGVSVAGLNMPKNASDEGVVDWLNGLGWNRAWGRLRSVKVADLNLLVRDDVQRAEWVLEQGNMSVYRYDSNGESGTLTAVVRRLYGDEVQLKSLDNVPVLISFAHGPKADGLIIRGRLDRANAQMVTDYFPPQFKDLLQAQGQVEIGTRLLEKDILEQPWTTLRLTDVKVHPPHGYSSSLEFPELTLTASYVPPAEGVSSSDVLLIKELYATTKRGNKVAVSGTIVGLQSDPMIDLTLASDGGEIQGIFDMLPDQEHGFQKALKWLQPNIMSGEYVSLTAHYAGKPSAFPGCGDECGILEIDAGVKNGTVRYLKEMTPVKAPIGTFRWRGQALAVDVPTGQIGGQSVSDVKVSMEHIFSVHPTELRVLGKVSGGVKEVMAELGKLPETRGKVPQGIDGKHTSSMDIYVPMPRGGEATFDDSIVQISSSLVGARVKDLPELKGLEFAAPKASVQMLADKTLRVKGAGLLGVYPMDIDWSMNLQPHKPAMMKIVADGTVTGDWLLAQAPALPVSMTGVVDVALDLQEDKAGKWNFGVKADGGRVSVTVPAAHVVKPRGEPLAVTAKGSYVPSGSIVLDTLSIQGNKLAVNGTVKWNPADVGSSEIKLPGLKIGETDVSVDFANNKATVSGKRLDLSGLDIFKADKTEGLKSKQPDNLTLVLNVDDMLMERGKLEKVSALLKATNGRWDVQDFVAFVDGTSRINVQMTDLKNQPGRRKLVIQIQDLGRTLDVLGIYDKLEHGKMTGEITYDSSDVGGGLIKLEDFGLKNPPTLVQLLNLLSLQQLMSGSSSTLFDKGTIPVRVDGDVWGFDNASFEGPSMSLRLDGYYTRSTKDLNFDGKMAPAIPLNRLVAKIPLLGTLLTGSQDGVVVADFKLKGPTDNPQINVRPLSVITPGLLKDFWRGLTGSEKKTPPHVIDGRTK